jgi:hypothetical protein
MKMTCLVSIDLMRRRMWHQRWCVAATEVENGIGWGSGGGGRGTIDGFRGLEVLLWHDGGWRMMSFGYNSRHVGRRDLG